MVDPYLDVVNNKYHWGATLCRVPIYTVTPLPENVDKQPEEHQQKIPRVSNIGVSIIYNSIYIYIIRSASRSHKFVVFFFQNPVFSSVMKKTENMFFFFTREKTYFFSHLVSWHLMIPCPRRFKPPYWYQPWIYPSQCPSRWLYFHPAGFGWQFSQERAQFSWNMSDNIKCDHNLSGVVGWFFPKNHPYKHKLKHGYTFFIGKKWFWIAKVQQTWSWYSWTPVFEDSHNDFKEPAKDSKVSSCKLMEHERATNNWRDNHELSIQMS